MNPLSLPRAVRVPGEQAPAFLLCRGTWEVISLDGKFSARENLDRPATAGIRFHAYPVLVDGAFRAVMLHWELAAAASAAASATPPPLIDQVSGRKNIIIVPETSIREAAHRMISHDCRQLPVVGQHDPAKLPGWLTLHDITRQQNAAEAAMERG